MGRPKKDNSYTKVFGVKIAEDQFNLIQLLSPADKAKLNNLTRDLVNRFTKIKVNQNKNIEEIKVNRNNEDKIKVNQNNSEEVLVNQNNDDKSVNQNNSSKPEIDNDNWTQDKISGFLDECIYTQTANNKRVKRSLRKLKNKKVQSEFEQAKAEHDAIEAAKYSGLNSLFGGGYK